MKYLFWNTHKNEKINSVLCDLIIENGISIVVLAEYVADINELIQLLDIKGVSMQQYPTIGCDRIHIVGEVGIHVEPKLHADHWTIQVVGSNNILCCVHLNSQIYSDNDEKREIDIQQIVDDVVKLEGELGARNTIIVGDFNINPYDKSCISARYFHGIPVYEEAKRESRTISGKEFSMFYNPMWNFLGDFNEPYGTYYHGSSNTVNPYWNVYDQVIIRPVLRKRFVDKNLRIITETEQVSLLDEKSIPTLQSATTYRLHLKSRRKNMSKKLDFAGLLDFSEKDLTAPNKVIEELLAELPGATQSVISGSIVEYSGPVTSYKTKSPGTALVGLLGEAAAETHVDIQDSLGKRGDEIHKFECFLYTSAYTKYKYRMFFVKYGIAHYPVQFTLEESIARSIQGANSNYVITCNKREEVEELILKILGSKKVLGVMQELIRISQAKKNEASVAEEDASVGDE